MTKYDKIRSMSVEELAEMQNRLFGCPMYKDGETVCSDNEYDCKVCWLKWLLSEVEE